MGVSKSVGRIDKPYRAPPEKGSIEDLRRALDRTNERIDALVRRLDHVEENILNVDSVWSDLIASTRSNPWVDP